MSNAQMDALIARLDTLGKDATKLVKKALAEPLKVVQKAARAGLAGSGINDKNRTIWRSIGRKVYTKRGSIVGAKVGVGVGMKNPRQRNAKGETNEEFILRREGTKNLVAFQSHLLSLGTRHRWTGSTSRTKRTRTGKVIGIGKTESPVQYRGFIRPNPYFKTATQASTASAKAAFVEVMDTEVHKALGK